jgi:hypothetical protein
VDALKQRRRETGSIAPHKQTKFRRRVLEGQEDRLRALVTAQPDATLAELRDGLRTSAALATIWRELNQLDLTIKKPYTPTNNVALTSRRSDGSGEAGCRSTMLVSMCFSMSAVSRLTCCAATAGVLVAPAFTTTRPAVIRKRRR